MVVGGLVGKKTPVIAEEFSGKPKSRDFFASILYMIKTKHSGFHKSNKITLLTLCQNTLVFLEINPGKGILQVKPFFLREG